MVRYSELYLDEASQGCAELFICAIEEKYNLVEFIRFYLNSRLREFMDEGYPLYLTMLGTELFDYLKKKEGLASKVHKTRHKADIFMGEWLGEFYSRLQWKLGISSKECLKRFPPEFILPRYNVLHDLDITEAIERVTKNENNRIPQSR